MKQLVTLFIVLISLAATAQTGGYQKPPKVMEELLLAKPTPSVSADSKGEWIVLSESNSYPSVEELGQPEIRTAGLRINPNNFAPSRRSFFNNLSLKNIKEGKDYKIDGLPANLLGSLLSWSPDEKKMAFAHTSAGRVDLYVIDVATKKCKQINKTPLNIVLGASFVWIDENTVLYKTILQPASAAPKKAITPDGPSVQESYGAATPRPTFQDLIKSPADEKLFAFYATAQLVKNVNGTETKIGAPGIYTGFSPSPDKKYLLLRTLTQPFSYIVPANGFSSVVNITDFSGKLIKELAKLPSSETAPSGNDNVQDVPRSFSWRDDEAATITWCKALDGGLIKNKADYRDAVYQLAAPFTGEPKEICKTTMRYGGITWGNAGFALLTEFLQSKQTLKWSRLNPATGETELLQERSMNDAYSFNGNPTPVKNNFGRYVVIPVNNQLLMNNTTGASAKGDLPFISRFDLGSKKNEIIWRCEDGAYEVATDILDPEKLLVLTRKERQQEVPNYYIRDLKNNSVKKITSFTNPYPALEGVSKQKVKYKRADGVDLTGDLYLPKGYDAKKDGPLPVILWAYPREFVNAKDAAQVRGSQYTFTRISWASPIFWVTQGYAVLDNAEMPIVSTAPDKKPNDDFVEQLRMNAKAAIDKLAEMGVGDSTRVGVGGHSYGAFMTANLLAHTNYFKAGIARSGAYNRTLTPFGFQNEDRTYWQAPDLYNEMSPFTYADKIKTPILLIHGEADDNTGTFPIQSERLFNAIKGNGGKVRYVVLPYEAHSYRGRENLLQMLYEQNQWLEKFVKNAKANKEETEKPKGF